MKRIEVLRGGNWIIEENKDIFNYKVKIINNSLFPLKNLEISLISFPKALEIDSKEVKISSLEPNSSKVVSFKFKVKTSAVGGHIEAICSFMDHLGRSHSIELEPLLVEYLSKLLTPIKYRGSQEDVIKYDPNIDFNQSLNTVDYSEFREKTSKESQLSRIYFSVYAPTSLSPDTDFILHVWAYLLEQKSLLDEIASEKGEYEKRAQKGPIQAKYGEMFQVCLHLPKPLKIKENIDVIQWYGQITNATFAVSVPKKIKSKSFLGNIKVFYDGIQLLRIDFTLKIGKKREKMEEVTQNVENMKNYFASYSSEDRSEVIKRIHGIRSIPGVEVFLDCLSMQQGDYWEPKIFENILKSDLFLLFWSSSASKSDYVKKEWTYALKNKGLDFIQPIPLEDPNDVPPPKELKSKHFNDICLIALRSL